jgi:cbb3-type cytochrome oxidase subunit 3
VTFIGIVQWAWSSRRRDAFDAAAALPFALSDETALAPPAPDASAGDGGARR